MSEQQASPGSAMLIIVGVVALIGALVSYAQEHKSNVFRGGHDYTLALLLLGAGAFLILLAVILSSGRRR